MEEFFDFIYKKSGKRLDKKQVKMLNPLVLAYIGDTIYDLFVRTYLVHTHDATVHDLNQHAIQFVKASSQSDMLSRIEGFLTDEEKDLVRRGRNAKSGTIPKNVNLGEYKRATGFETLLGYLFLSNQGDRLCEVLGQILDIKSK